MIDIALIPAPVKHDPETGVRLPSTDWIFPRSEAYEAAARAALPPGWTLYVDLDGEKHPNDAAKDFGATRDDGRGRVHGIRELSGAPLKLRGACSARAWPYRGDKTFAAGDLAAACRWVDGEVIASVGAPGVFV